MLTKLCKNSKIRKLIAIALLITMLLVDFLFVGKNLISYAFEENLEAQTSNTQHANVRFDAYFTNSEGSNIHSAVCDAMSDSNQINVYLAVRNVGYLKEAYLDFRDSEGLTNTNYEIASESINTSLVQSVNESLKTITLNNIYSETEAVLQIPISLELAELVNIDKLNQNTFVVLRGIYVNENGEEVDILKTTKLNLGWNIETELEVEQAVTKYVSYVKEDVTNTVIQIAVKVKQDKDDKVMPVKSTELKIKVPEISETLPKKVTVVAGSTLATNGGKIEFTSEDWEYNEEEKTITISTKGYEENGTVWSGVGTDEYFITYVYENINSQEETEIILPCEVKAKMEMYTRDGIATKEAESIGEATLSEKVEEIVSYIISAKEDEISKGKIYANYNSDTKTYDTEYSSTIEVNVSDYEIVNEIKMQLPTDNFTNKEAMFLTKANGNSYTNLKTLSISKNQIQNLLGEEGYIYILDDKSNVYVINNNSEESEEFKKLEEVDGIYTIEFEDGVGDVLVQTSKPIADGILKIDVTKSISKDLPYSKEEAKKFEQLKLSITGITSYATDIIGNNATEIIVEDAISLTETSTHATLQISNNSLTSMTENKNVEMTIVLNNNLETSDLYKNAVFTINLPKYIEDIEITTGNIIYTSGLEIDYLEKLPTENGIVLVLHTKGAEATFSDGIFTNGANIVLNTNIKVNELTPNISDKITMTYTNESAISYKDDLAYDEVAVNFVSPQEMVTFNTVLASGVQATSTDGQEQVAKVEILDASKIATMKITILNKYSNTCNNIRILGRTPFVGNKEITTGNDLGTTFDAKVISGINANGIPAVIYYSENGEASEDLSNIANGWTTDISELNEVKSYLITLPTYEMKVGETLEFSYNCQIPENLEHNESAYGTYVVYFDTISEYVANNFATALRAGVTTGVGANIEMNTKTIYQGREITESDSVKEYQTVTYRTTISNTGEVDAIGVELTSTIENGTITSAKDATINGQTITWNFDLIKAGETKTVEYDVIINNTTNKIQNKLNLTAENFEGALDKTVENIVEKSELRIKLFAEETELINNYEDYIRIIAENTSDRTINNIIIEQDIPEGLDILNNTDTIQYDKETKKIIIRVDKLEPKEMFYKKIDFRTNIPNNVKEFEMGNMATIRGDETDIYYSNTLRINAKSTVLNINLNSNITSGSYINKNNTLEITGYLQNVGSIQSPSAKIYIQTPSEFKATEATYQLPNGTIGKLKSTTSGKYYVLTTLDVEDKVSFNIKGTVSLRSDVTEKEVSFVAYASDTYRETIYSNEFKYIVENISNNPNNPQNPSNPNNPTVSTYKITGTAWLDENEDGQKQSTEKLMQNVNVLLVDSNGTMVTDMVNGTVKETVTDSNGQYTFTNIPQGKYMVIFEYDTAHYDVTEYKKAGLTEDLISKAKTIKITKNGKESVAAVTDVINITNSSVSNINIGFVEREKFDLSLTKQLARVTVANSGGVTEYDFTNTKLGKIDVPGKYLNSTTVTLEYRIIVKNEGAIAGYAKNIVDYMSKDLSFDGNQNLYWHMGQDGNLYSNALTNTLIKPGEEKVVVLTLTKKMNENNTGIITNRAEIYEDYNEYGYSDYNSTPANASQKENDYDSVDVIVTVKTGQVAIYITITLISIAIIGAGAYFVNKKVLKGGRT